MSLLSKFRTGMGIRTYLLALSIAIVTIFLLVVSFVSYRVTVSSILERTEHLDESNLKQVNNKIDITIGEIERLTSNFSKNEQLIGKVLQLDEASDSIVDKLHLASDIVQLLNEMKAGYEDIDKMEIYAKDETEWVDKITMLPSGPRILRPDIYHAIRNTPRNAAVFAPGTSHAAGDSLKGFAFGSVMYDDNREIGIVYVLMKPQWMNQVFADNHVVLVSKDSRKAIWSSSGEPDRYEPVLDSAKDGQGTFFETIDGEKYRFFYIKSAYNDWLTLTFKSLEDIYTPVKKIRMYVLVTASISCLISLLFAVTVSAVIAKPIVNLQGTVRAYRAQEQFPLFHMPLKNRGIRKIFMLYFVTVTTVPMLIYIVAFYFSCSSVIEAKVKDSILLAFRQTLSNVDSFISINERISTNIMVNPFVQQYLVSGRIAGGDGGIDYKEQFGKSIDENLSLADNIFESALFNSEKKLLFSTSNFNRKETIHEQAANYSGIPYWVSNDLDPYNRNVIRLIRKIRGIRSDDHFLKTIGYLQTTYYESSIESLYREVKRDNDNVFIMNREGIVVSHTTKAFIGKQPELLQVGSFPVPGTIEIISSKDSGNLLVLAASAKVPWLLVGELDDRALKGDSLRVLATCFYILLGLTIVAIVFSHAVAAGLTRSIGLLRRKLGLMADGHPHVDFSVRTEINEIRDLGNAFNAMAARIRELIDTVYRSTLKEEELEHEKKEAELVALQAQINPHFLYNTMESVKWMVKGGKIDKAVDMITALGSLFQIGIRRENKLITVNEELDYARAYVDIQKVRLGDKVTFWWSVDKTLLPFLMPRLILQPIIENAIMHGVQKKRGGGSISIYGYEEGETIVFKIVDDGVGMSAEQRKADGGSGIGIGNVRKRIHLYFGEEYGVYIDSRPQMGTIASIIIPRMLEERTPDRNGGKRRTDE